MPISNDRCRSPLFFKAIENIKRNLLPEQKNCAISEKEAKSTDTPYPPKPSSKTKKISGSNVKKLQLPCD